MQKVIFLILGIAFGYVLIVSGVSNYDVIRDMFLFRSIHLYGVLGIAVILSFIAIYIMKKLKIKSVLDSKEIDTSVEKLGRHHVIGGLLAGFGWALTGACPGPAIAQIGFGTMAGLFTAAGIFLGVYIFGARQKT